VVEGYRAASEAALGNADFVLNHNLIILQAFVIHLVSANLECDHAAKLIADRYTTGCDSCYRQVSPSMDATQSCVAHSSEHRTSREFDNYPPSTV